MTKISLLLLIIISLQSIIVLKQENSLEESKIRGKLIYLNYCLICHQENGEGMSGVFPPLAGSDYLMKDIKRAIRTIIYGENGEISVNGITYFGDMPGQDLTDQEIADVVNYIQNSWGNKALEVRVEDITVEKE